MVPGKGLAGLRDRERLECRLLVALVGPVKSKALSFQGMP